MKLLDETGDIINKFGKLEVLHNLAKLGGYEEPVPDINTFIDDPYYLGKHLGDGLYPVWRESLNKIFPTPYYSSYQEIILSGAIGLGKSTVSIAITLYDICKMLSLKNPHEHYNLIESTVISYALMNATKGLAGAVLYSQIVEWIEASPYFKSKLSKKYSKTLFIKNIDITVGSRGRDMLGQATAGAIFSEINDMTVVGDQAQDNFDTIATRRNSRFGGKGLEKPINGHLILDSSNKGIDSFVSKRVEDKRKNNIEDYIIFSFSQWEARKSVSKYSGEKFKVYCGDENRDPFIVNEENSFLLESLNTSRVLDVPIEHYEEFNANIIKSLRDIAGVSTYNTFNFISSNELIINSLSRPDIVTKSPIILDFFDQDQIILNYIDIKTCSFLNKNPRFIHIDLGIKWDSTGISCVYQDGFKETEKYDPMSGKKLVIKEPVYVVEWVIEIRAVSGHEVPIYKIKQFLYESKSLGFPIHTISTDGYQSTNLRQDLTLLKFTSDLISVDRTKDPYNYLKTCMLEERISMPYNLKLEKELKDLVELPDKIDHPKSGCFTGDTEIILIDKLSNEKVLKRFDEIDSSYYDKYYIISYNENNEFQFTDFTNCRITKEVTELLELELEDGYIFRCTPEHLILTDKGYKKAIDLNEEDNLIKY